MKQKAPRGRPSAGNGQLEPVQLAGTGGVGSRHEAVGVGCNGGSRWVIYLSGRTDLFFLQMQFNFILIS